MIYQNVQCKPVEACTNYTQQVLKQTSLMLAKLTHVTCGSSIFTGGAVTSKLPVLPLFLADTAMFTGLCLTSICTYSRHIWRTMILVKFCNSGQEPKKKEICKLKYLPVSLQKTLSNYYFHSLMTEMLMQTSKIKNYVLQFINT